MTFDDDNFEPDPSGRVEQGCSECGAPIPAKRVRGNAKTCSVVCAKSRTKALLREKHKKTIMNESDEERRLRLDRNNKISSRMRRKKGQRVVGDMVECKGCGDRYPFEGGGNQYCKKCQEGKKERLQESMARWKTRQGIVIVGTKIKCRDCPRTITKESGGHILCNECKEKARIETIERGAVKAREKRLASKGQTWKGKIGSLVDCVKCGRQYPRRTNDRGRCFECKKDDARERDRKNKQAMRDAEVAARSIRVCPGIDDDTPCPDRIVLPVSGFGNTYRCTDCQKIASKINDKKGKRRRMDEYLANKPDKICIGWGGGECPNKVNLSQNGYHYLKDMCDDCTKERTKWWKVQDRKNNPEKYRELDSSKIVPSKTRKHLAGYPKSRKYKSIGWEFAGARCPIAEIVGQRSNMCGILEIGRRMIDYDHILARAWLREFDIPSEKKIIGTIGNVWLASSEYNRKKGARLLIVFVKKEYADDLLIDDFVERARAKCLEAADAVIAAMAEHYPGWDRGEEMKAAIRAA